MQATFELKRPAQRPRRRSAAPAAGSGPKFEHDRTFDSTDIEIRGPGHVHEVMVPANWASEIVPPSDQTTRLLHPCMHVATLASKCPFLSAHPWPLAFISMF